MGQGSSSSSVVQAARINETAWPHGDSIFAYLKIVNLILGRVRGSMMGSRHVSRASTPGRGRFSRGVAAVQVAFLALFHFGP
jgi:hypothetical protein